MLAEECDGNSLLKGRGFMLRRETTGLDSVFGR
jgi:hypothetical protein